MAEDARIITVKKIDEERLASERQAGAEREARPKADVPRHKPTPPVLRGKRRRRGCRPVWKRTA